MKKFLRKNKKYIGLILIVVIAFNFLFLPLTALAAPAPAKDDSAKADSGGGLISWLTGKSVLFVSSTVSALFGFIFGVILSLEAQIIDYILSPVNFSFTNSPVVVLGWGITRDIANMFFILILLVIAFATVLKIQSYAIKQLWWKILVAALLINFSLVIAGFVIDFTQILTAFFLKHATGGGSFGTITTRLASSMQILNFYNPATPKTIEGGLLQFGASSIAAAIGIILTLVGLVITVFVFGALVIFLIVRILYIWFLLIVAPLVWMLWILPATSGYFKRWWDDFIKWTFFAPVYVFMIYLSLSIFEANGKLNPKAFWAVSIPGWTTPAPGLTTVGMPAAIFQWILVIAMMFGSLIVATKFGVAGAKAVQGATKGAAKASALWGVKTQGRIATAIGGAAAGTGAGAPTTGTGILATGIARPPGIIRRTIGTIGAYATGTKGGKFTAPLKKTLNNPLKAILNGAVVGSGLWKKKTQKFKLPSGETLELESVEEKEKKEGGEKEKGEDKKEAPQGQPIFEEAIEEKNWRCTYDSNVQVLSKEKPAFACPKAATHPAGAPPAAWTEV